MRTRGEGKKLRTKHHHHPSFATSSWAAAELVFRKHVKRERGGHLDKIALAGIPINGVKLVPGKFARVLERAPRATSNCDSWLARGHTLGQASSFEASKLLDFTTPECMHSGVIC